LTARISSSVAALLVVDGLGRVLDVVVGDREHAPDVGQRRPRPEGRVGDDVDDRVLAEARLDVASTSSITARREVEVDVRLGRTLGLRKRSNSVPCLSGLMLVMPSAQQTTDRRRCLAPARP
jgi:hypothetical protein